MLRHTLSVALFLALRAAAGLHAQENPDDPVDVQSRFGMQVNLNLPRKWESSIGYEGRLTGNSSVYYGSYYSAELGRPVGKHLAVFANYRLAQFSDQASHRYGLGGELEAKRAKVTLSFRTMFQHLRKGGVDDDEQAARNVLRTRVRAKLDATKRIAVYASTEPFFAFAGIYPVDNWRNTAGAQWEFRKGFKFDLHYIYRPDYGKMFNRTYHIVGAEVSMDLKFPP